MKLDPPITSKGISMAKEAADTIKQIQDNMEGNEINAVYSSRMLRAVMTAYPIAKKLSLPLVVSRGLARSVSNVRSIEKDGGFDFNSFERLSEYCKGVTVVDADAESEPMISQDSWIRACGDVARLAAASASTGLVVGHREIPRGLADDKNLPAPHCCIYTFDVADTGSDKSDYSVVHGFARNGIRL